jgi:hypothetical protein
MERLVDLAMQSVGRTFLKYSSACPEKPFKIGAITNVNAFEVSFCRKNGEFWQFECYYPISWEEDLVKESDMHHTLQEIFEMHSAGLATAYPHKLVHGSLPGIGIKIGTYCEYQSAQDTFDFLNEILEALSNELQNTLL